MTAQIRHLISAAIVTPDLDVAEVVRTPKEAAWAYAQTVAGPASADDAHSAVFAIARVFLGRFGLGVGDAFELAHFWSIGTEHRLDACEILQSVMHASRIGRKWR
jgi:hypothetical protein